MKRRSKAEQLARQIEVNGRDNLQRVQRMLDPCLSPDVGVARVLAGLVENVSYIRRLAAAAGSEDEGSERSES